MMRTRPAEGSASGGGEVAAEHGFESNDREVFRRHPMPWKDSTPSGKIRKLNIQR